MRKRSSAVGGSEPSAKFAPRLYRDLIAQALAEDAPAGDITTASTVAQDSICTARLIAKESLTLAGIGLFEEAFRILDPNVKIKKIFSDGQAVPEGSVVATIKGNARAILTAERVALNFLQRLSGVATLTRKFADAVEGTACAILDTRKTTPLLRDLEKYAVRMGGGKNHRRDLSAMALIKENHIAAVGGIVRAVDMVKKSLPRGAFIEVEVRNMAELEQALNADVDRVLLDNMTPAQVKACVKTVGGRAKTEASGNMTVKNVRAYAKTGVDYISVGKLTHSAPASDFSLLIEPGKSGRAK
ncbi:MAG: carboxylating nicotinate-nucleotide diphosphorylase [Nitrospinae bacterium]|nr:carboxylating nicotinate-nucleotide diphosphorylase [Nitrospinota bacterium]